MSIVVIGSINIDLVTEAKNFPQKGETIVGNSFHTFFGGKGANQAVCAARLGIDVQFIGCVGDDINGVEAITNLSNNNIDVTAIRTIDDVSTGVAQITIAEDDNSIIIVKGANDYVTKDIIDENLDIILRAELVLLQLEIPLKTVEYIIDICHKNGIRTVLNPAPAVKLSNEILDKVTYITPNETEYDFLFNGNYTEGLERYPNKLIVTQGANGVDYYNGEEIVTIKAHKVDVVDTTGAGDSFNAALCVGIVKRMSLSEAISFGNKVASYSIKKLGAQTSMPYLTEIE
ncbi:ribokinase [Candidatus Izimaplasma bacterium]|nr:ribokinase [Candidatus Izimaplasma bacterium]